MKTGTIIYTPQEIVELRMNVASEVAKGTLNLTRLSRRLHCSLLTIHKHAADLLQADRLKHVGTYAPKGAKLQFPIMGYLLEAAGIEIGATITVRVAGPRRIIITAEKPECPSLKIQRYGKV